jgi:1-acyl-sn-glycerol-3-phosphate acyltransferase
VAVLTRRLFEFFARSAFRWYCPLRVTGRDHLPPLPFIVCSNHASHMDSVALMAATGLPFDRFAMLAASDYFFRNAIVYRLFSAMVQLIPINRSGRGGALAQTIALCRRFLDGGKRGLIIFPEGTRSTSGAIAPFKRGISVLSTELELPIVPVYVAGTDARMPKGRLFPLPGAIQVHIGSPIQPDEEADHDAVAGVVEASIRALKNESSLR